MTDPFGQIGAYYDRLLQRYGDDPRSCDYGSPASQALKFRAMTQVMPLNGKRVLDVGCGLGDIADYIRASGAHIDYCGYDISPEMIRRARLKHPDLRFELRNILEEPPTEKFDVVLASGIFYLLGPKAPELSRALIRAMYAACSQAVAFTTISAWADAHEPSEYYADPLELMAFCHTLTPWLALQHDYHHRDFTIYMYRERQ